VPLDVLSSLGVSITQEALDWDLSSKTELQNRASSAAILRDGEDRWGLGFDPFTADPDSKTKMVFGIDVARIPREVRIAIPTVHVYGSRDPRFPASVTLAQFCDEGVRRTFDHGGGHEIPRKKDVSAMLAELVEWCGMMVERW
jgi:hypothetical protein